MSVRGIRSIVAMSTSIADEVIARVIRHLEDRLREVVSHWHDVATEREAGFLPKLSGKSTDVLHGDGTWGP